MKTSQRINMKMQNGAEYVIALFSDAKNKPCAKKDAVFIELCEYNGDDEQIGRIYLKKDSQLFEKAHKKLEPIDHYRKALDPQVEAIETLLKTTFERQQKALIASIG